jgi:ATP-dependent Clp protease protease subunit
MARPEEKYRKILLSDEIESSSVKDAIKEIMEINRDDELKTRDYVDWKRKPIKLYINSFGGSVYDGLALVDVIKQSITPVHTICIGSAMSMGFWIYLAGEKRYVGENSTLMFHDISTWIWDKSETIRQELKEMLRLQEMLISEIESRSLVKRETLDDIINRKAEWYIPSDEAIRLKLSDGYYKENDNE